LLRNSPDSPTTKFAHTSGRVLDWTSHPHICPLEDALNVAGTNDEMKILFSFFLDLGIYFLYLFVPPILLFLKIFKFYFLFSMKTPGMAMHLSYFSC
jgi:hypothetical protein